MTTAAASDPFETTANPARYVPRPASERALGAVELALVQGRGPILLTGPPGIGKTMLLGVLSRRLAETYRVVRVPYAALSGPEICRWVLHELADGGPPEDGGDDPEGALLDRAFREAAMGRELLLLVDDATALPPGAARSLVTLVAASGGAVRAVLAAVDDDRLAGTRTSLGSDVREIRFDEPMDAEETAAYVRARIAGADGHAEGPPDPRAARFDADTLARLYGATGGIPRRVHELGSLLWRGDDPAGLPERIAAWVREERGGSPPPVAADAAPEREVGTEPERGEGATPPPEVEPGASETPAAPPAPAVEPPAPAVEPAAPEREPPAPEPEPPTPEREPPAPEPGFEPMSERDTGAGQGAGPASVEPPPGGRRPRGLWFALIGLALLAVALPYARSRFEGWVDAGLAPTPSATRPPVPAPPDEPAPLPIESIEPEPEIEPEGDVSVEPGEAPVDGEDTSVEETAEVGEPLVSEEPEAEPDAAPEPEPSPVAEPESAPPPQPEPEPAPQPEPEPAPQPEPEPAVAPSPEPATPPQPDAAPAPRAQAEPTPELPPRAEPTPEPPPQPAPPRAAPGELLVRVEGSPGARVYVDGGMVGETPLDAISLSPGLHVFRAEFPSGRIMVRAVEVSAANRVVDMEPPR